MTHKTEYVILFFIGLFFIVAGEVMLTSGTKVSYDCRLVDVSPDIPEQVKKICRSRR